MAITWGATSGYFRLGIDIKVSGTTATIIVYGQSVGYGHNWTYPLNFTGSWSGSKRVSFYSGTGQTVTKELHRSSASFTGTRTYGANISYWNGAASVSRSVTISPPPKPTPPATPGLSKISRSSDTQHVLSWSHSGGATGFSIERRDYVDGAWGAWRVVGAVNSTSARSYTDADTVAGRAYQWRMRARNSVGYSAYSGVSLVTPTTPTVVPSVTAKRAGSGVRVAWAATNSSPSYVSWEIMHDVSGGSSTQVGGSQAGGAREYVHASPDATRPQSYRVRQVVRSPHDGGKTLYGPWGASNTVQLIAKPAAPTVVWPQPEQMYGLGQISLRWTHNAVDESEQSKATVQIWKDNQKIFQIVIDGADDVYLWTPPSIGRYVVNVQTLGSHPDWSDWSGGTAFTVADYPDVTVLSPVDVVGTNTAVAAWDVSQAQGYRQNAFRLSLFDIGGVELGVWEGTGNTTVYPLPYTVENNTEYVLTVEVATNDLWSLPVEQYFRVKYAPPATPIIDVTWDDDTGAATVYADAGLADIQAENKVPNWSFETGYQPWRSNFGLNASHIVGVSDAWHGAKVVQSTIGSSVFHWIFLPFENAVPTEPDRVWEARARVRTVGGEGRAYAGFRAYQANGEWNVPGSEVPGLEDGQWETITYRYKSTSKVVRVTPLIGVAAERGTVFQIDAVELRDVTEAVATPPTKRIDLYRSVDGGVSWELVLEDFEPDTALSDYRCLTYGETLYKATAFTDIGGVAEAVFVLDVRSDKMWIGAGPGYVQTIGLQYNPGVSGSVEAERASLVFDGRVLPVPVAGVARSQSMGLSGWLLEDEGESLDALLGLIQGDFVTHLVRIPGRSVYGIITSVDWDYKRGGAWPVSFTIRETEPEAS